MLPRNEPISPVVGPEAPPLSRWKKARLVVKVVELRLRFIALMAITALTFAYWDTIWNRYDKWARPASERVAAARTVEFYCPMHPQVVRDEPGSCPICGMPLSKRKKGEVETLPEGVTARIQLAPLRIKQAGIKTAEVAYAPLTETVTTVGTVDFDERKLANISSKVRGMSRVETLSVNFTGQDVKAGDTLAELYSPELYQAVNELLLARRSAREAPRMQTAIGRSALGDPEEMTRLASEKLKLWGLTQNQIDEILRKGKAEPKVAILSPIAGHVVKKNVVEGQYVPEGQSMFEVADLSTVWVKAQVYEDQIGLVRVGQEVEATVGAVPGRTFRGKVAFIQPHLDPTTRTVEVRYDLPNADHELRPGMFATVTLRTPVAETPMFRARLASARKAIAPEPGPSPKAQENCPVTGLKLGSMGAPVPVEALGRKFLTCCDACPPKVKATPARYLAKLPPLTPPGRPAQPTAAEQGTCPVTGLKLGSMGDPIAVDVGGKRVWVCCPACPPKLKADPAKYLARLLPPPTDGVLTVPESAVIDTGEFKVVYVESEPGVFEGRRVVLGARSGDRFPVLEGLSVGEKVAAAGAFLIDAESRINPTVVAPAPEPAASPTVAAPRSAAAPPEGVHRH